MAYRRRKPFKRRRRYKRRTYKKRRYMRRTKAVSFPAAVNVKFRYQTTVVLSNYLTDPYNHVFRGNSLFDPDLTGGGHQPVGFDQWSAFYNKYRVMGCKMVIRAITISSVTNANQMIITLTPNDQNATFTSASQAIENPNTKFTILSNEAQQRTIKMYKSTAQILGVRKKAVLDDDTYASVTSTSPADIWFYIINVWFGPYAAASTCTMYVELTYYAKMFSRNALSLS